MTLADRLQTKSRVVQRLVAVGLVPTVIVSAWVLVASPLKWVLTSQSSWRESVRSELARARGEAATLKMLTERSVAFPSAAIWQRVYGDGTQGSAGSAVQQDVTRLCSSAGMQPQSVTLLPSEQAGPLVRYTVRVSMTGTADRFQAFLTQLRTGPRYLRVEKLAVSSPQSQRADENAPLTIGADIVGFGAERPKAPVTPAT
ncbi:MAG: type II secretion system protein GspM [Gammaproteobacteria bacterium]